MTDFKLERKQSRLGGLYNDFEDWFMEVIVDNMWLHMTRLGYGLAIFAGLAIVVAAGVWILFHAPLWTIGGVMLIVFIYLIGYLIEDW